MNSSFITFLGAGRPRIIEASFLHTIPLLHPCTVALTLHRTVRVSHKCSFILSLQLCTFPPCHHSSQFFSVSALLRESFARFFLRSLVIKLSCSLSLLFSHYVSSSVYIFDVFDLSFFRPCVSSSLRPYIFPPLRQFAL